MARRTGGQAIVDGLLAHGIDTVFGVPGAQTYGLFDALHQVGDQTGHQVGGAIRTIGPRHEQTCGYMAFGYARSTGRPAVCSVVPGPGLMNASAALLTAFGCNEPVLCLTGQVPSGFLGQGRGQLHEMPDQLATLRGFVKWADRIDATAQAPYKVARAFQEMRSARPGPAALEMPWEQFTTLGEVAAVAPLPLTPDPQPDMDRVEQAVALIRDARAPMIMVGGGALDSGPEIAALAERLGAPVTAFRSGRGVVSEHHRLGLDFGAAYRLWPETDLLIGIGTRLEVPGWRWPVRTAAPKLVRIDIDPAEFRRHAPDVGILATAKAGTRALLERLEAAGHAGRDRSPQVAAAKQASRRDFARVQPQMDYLAAIRDVLPPDGVFVNELSQVGFAAWYGFPIDRPRTFIDTGYPGTLGFGFPTALGVKVANPDKAVVSIAGDGGLMFGIQELSTAAQYGIAVVVIVFNNSSFGNVRRDQRVQFDGRLIGSDLPEVDFVRVAEAFGVSASKAASPDRLRIALSQALATGKPHLIEVKLARGAEASPWEFIMPTSAAGA